MAALNSILLQTADFMWSYIIVGLCLATGIYASLRLKFIQFRSFPHAIALLRGKYEDANAADGITTFQALSTALSGTTGIGNIAGVAVAIKLGGPGAIFWMWMMALIGMALKYVEATLGSLYRGPVGTQGEMGGGPMYYMTRGLGERWRPLAVFYSVCTAIACLGAWNMFQSNQAAATLHDQFSVPVWLTGLLLSGATGLVLIGGIKRISQVAGRLVPLMCAIYLLVVFVICAQNFAKIPYVFGLILDEAFRFESAGGGVLGTVILIGIRRAVFSNEAGTGSAAIAHAAAHTQHPVRQGIVASLGPFIDTVVVCAATAFVILLSGFYGSESYQNQLQTRASFEQGASDMPARGWALTGSAVPADDHPLQQFRDGEQVLALRTVELSSTAAVLSSRVNLTALLGFDSDSAEKFDAIRFSLTTTSAHLSVRLLRADGSLLVELPVAAGSAPVSREAKDMAASISASRSQSQWHSRVITPNTALRAAVLEGSEEAPVYLQFAARGPGEIFIDRIELVADVSGIVLSTAAFSQFFGFFGGIFIPIAALFFAYTTILVGNYYGEVACHYLNEKWVRPYLWLYIAATFAGCAMDLDIVINFSDLALGMMTIPNFIAMLVLTPVVVRETKHYFGWLREEQR